MTITQKTYLSKTSIVVTIFVVALMIGIAISMLFIGKEVAWVSILVLAVLVGICASAMFFMPTWVEADDEALTVIFPWRRRSFLLSDIAEGMPFADAKKMWRLCGSGAFFGWWGWYAAKGTGKFMLYASNLDDLLLLKLANGKKYVISCVDSAQLLQKLTPPLIP